MKIRRFLESEGMDISPDRVTDILEILSSMVADVNQKIETVDSFINELNNFKSDSKSNNDQIDDSVSNLELLRGHLKDSIDKMDNTISSMRDYNQSGRKYLY